MQIGISFFKSRIARRIFILFIGCAFLPLAILIGYSYQRVENQLYQESMLRMDKDCKVYGMALIDRLVNMNNLIHMYVSHLVNGQSPLVTYNILRDQIVPTFVGLGLYKTGSGLETLYGDINLYPDVVLFDHLLLQQGKSTIYTRGTDSPNRTVYVLVPFTAAGTHCLLVAQPETTVLWGIGVNSVLPSMTELAVYNEKSQLIAATQTFPGTALPATTNQSGNRNYLRFEYKIDGETYLARDGHCFLNPILTLRPGPSSSVVLAQTC